MIKRKVAAAKMASLAGKTITVILNAAAQAAGFTTHVALRAARACLNVAVTTLVATANTATKTGFLAPAKSLGCHK